MHKRLPLLVVLTPAAYEAAIRALYAHGMRIAATHTIEQGLRHIHGYRFPLAIRCNVSSNELLMAVTQSNITSYIGAARPHYLVNSLPHMLTALARIGRIKSPAAQS